MKAHHMKPVISLIIHPGIAMALTVFLLTPVQARGAEDATMEMPACCHAVMNQKQKVRDVFKAQDADINDQITRMNGAPEDKKMGLMANIITLLVEQRTARDERWSLINRKTMMQAQCPVCMMDERRAKCHKSHGWIGMHDAPWDTE